MNFQIMPLLKPPLKPTLKYTIVISQILFREGKPAMIKITSAKARMIFFVLTVVLFVLGSGAPEAGGGVILRSSWFIGF